MGEEEPASAVGFPLLTCTKAWQDFQNAKIEMSDVNMLLLAMQRVEISLNVTIVLHTDT